MHTQKDWTIRYGVQCINSVNRLGDKKENGACMTDRGNQAQQQQNQQHKYVMKHMFL